MKRTLDLTQWLDRRELKARVITTIQRYAPMHTAQLQWLLAAVEAEPDNQQHWDDLNEEHAKVTAPAKSV